MTDAPTIVRRLIAKKYPNAGRYLFEEHELVQLIEAVQADAAVATTDNAIGIHERCSQSADREGGSELQIRSVAGEWVHLECSACALEVSVRLPWLNAAAAGITR